MKKLSLTRGAPIIEMESGYYAIPIKMVINDGEENIFDKKIHYFYDTNIHSFEEAKSEFLQKIKDEWDKYSRCISDSNLDGIDIAIEEVIPEAQDHINS